jgi:acetoin:2,6-dichlorophenolindophenol oxidoreductase subunit alpha
MDKLYKEELLKIYKKVYLIRSAELAIQKHYAEDEMKTPMHMSMGEEAIVVGVISALGTLGQSFGYYRSHALYLAITENPETFFLELYGKQGGAVGGRGGSMHLSSPENGLLGVSAIVASTVSPAVGAAFANQYLGNNKIVATFFGDGAFEEGTVLESLNVACLMKLPIIFVCEDNDLAVDVLSAERQGFKSISSVVKAYRCLLIESDSTNPYEVNRLTKIAINHIHENNTPVFMRLKYYRLLQHIGITSDFEGSTIRESNKFERAGYRSESEYKKQLLLDPLAIGRKEIIALGIADSIIGKLENQVDQVVKLAIVKAKKAKAPELSELYEYLYPTK